MTISRIAPDRPNIAPGLHFIATPIGAARDITLRALDILAGADVLAAEDTRTLRHLMEIHGIHVGGRQLIAYHDHNGEAVRPRLIAALKDGKSVAYASEAGTPLVADPGFQLARAAIAEGVTVLDAPGPSALLCALAVAGLPTDRFMFAGFLPNRQGARQSALADLAHIPATLVLYESPKRLVACLHDMEKVLGRDRQAAVCRELTKKYEEVVRGTLSELVAAFSERDVKGEVVIVVNRAAPSEISAASVEEALKSALQSHSVKHAVTFVAETLGMSRRGVYQLALKLEAKK